MWTWNVREDPSWLEHLRRHLSELTSYLDANADSLPNYGARHRQGAAISTAFVESTVNEIVSRRMVKRQQMRWNRETVQPFLMVRVHVLNATLEDAFRHWHRAFRPAANAGCLRRESGVGADFALSIATAPPYPSHRLPRCGRLNPCLNNPPSVASSADFVARLSSREVPHVGSRRPRHPRPRSVSRAR